MKALEAAGRSGYLKHVLSLAFHASMLPPGFSAGDKWMFFGSVSKLTSLKTLQVPEGLWKALMADGDDVAEPLWKLKGLVVDDVDTGARLAPASELPA